MKRKKRGALLWACFLLFMGIFTGCGETQTEEGNYKAYYISKDGLSLVERSVSIESTETDEMIEEFLDVLTTDTEDVEYRKAIPSDTTVEEYSLSEKGSLTLNFDSGYSKMDSMTEVLCRAAVVETLIQVPDVNRIYIYIDGIALKDANGEEVGAMTADSFVQNPGEQINSIQETTLTLYFANAEGNALVKELRDVHYSSNVSMEKLIVEELIEGPETEGALSTIPEGTTILSVSAVDGVCYVNFGDGFRNQNYEIQEEIVIYSIVNSLLELDGIEKVQISINGDNSGYYRSKCSLSTLYEQDLSYLEETVIGTEEVGDTEL